MPSECCTSHLEGTVTRRCEAPAYETLDGSRIRELMHPAHHAACNQSLAEAEIAPDKSTHLHRHHAAEEFYHVLRGHGVMTLGEETFPVAPGDTVRIAPGVAHKVRSSGRDTLRILCCCSPPYEHADTEILEQSASPVEG